MKPVAATLICFLVASAWAQGEKNSSEPEVTSVFFYLDASDQLVPLESQVIRLHHKYHALGFAGGTTVYLVNGEKSKVRLRAESKPEFVVRLEGKVNPLAIVQFYRFNGENNSRVMPVVDFDPFGRVSRDGMSLKVIDFNVVNRGNSSLKLIPLPALVAGEFCLVIKDLTQWPGRIPGSCFGVDAGDIATQ